MKNLIEKDTAIKALSEKARETGGLGRGYFEKATRIVESIPVVDVETAEKEAPRWNTGRPKKKGLYLCYMILTEDREWQEVCSYVGRGEWQDLDGFGNTNEVAYWMQLPEKP